MSEDALQLPQLDEASSRDIAQALRATNRRPQQVDPEWVRARALLLSHDRRWLEATDEHCIAVLHQALDVAEWEAEEEVIATDTLPPLRASGSTTSDAEPPEVPFPPEASENRPGPLHVPPRAIPRTWLDDLEMPKAKAELAEGLLAEGALGIIFGEPKCGKTFFTADLSYHVAAKLPWRGRATSGRPVVYVAAEAGATITPRFIALRERHGPKLHGRRVPLAVVTRAVNLLQIGDVGEFLHELRRVTSELGEPPGLVVLDTLSRSAPGADENGGEAWGTVIGVADMIRDEFGAATLIVHHCGKDPTKGMRGNSNLPAAADVILTVQNRVATVTEMRDGAAGDSFPFDLEIVEVGPDSLDKKRRTTCLIVPKEGGPPDVPPRGPPLPGAAKAALQALYESIDEHGESLPSTSAVPRAVRAVKLDRWRDRFRLRYGTDGGEDRDAEAIRKAFQRAREALLRAEAIGIADPYAWPTQKAGHL